MNHDAFAQYIGFPDFDTLLNASEVVAHERGNDVQWYITKLPSGLWTAWDDSELDLDRLEYATNKIEALNHVYDGLIAAGYDCGDDPVAPKYRVRAEM